MNKTSCFRRVSAAFAVFLMSGTAVAYAAECSKPRELTAYHMRQLQTDLMVASLSCRAEDRYNAFIERFNGVLTTNGKLLKKHFKQRFGAQAKAALNDYVTALANMSSIDSISAGANYCAQSQAAFDAVLSLNQGELEGFANAWWDASRQVPETDCRYDTFIASSD